MDDLQSSEEVKWESWETERGRREGFVPPGCLQLNDKLSLWPFISAGRMGHICDLCHFLTFQTTFVVDEIKQVIQEVNFSVLTLTTYSSHPYVYD